MSPLLTRALSVLTLVAASVVVTQPAAHAAGCPDHLANGSYCTIASSSQEKDELTDIATYPDHDNPGGPVASCVNDGQTCTLTVTYAVSTTVGASLGVSKSVISGGLNFSLSRTVTSSASCTSPKLKKGQKFIAYRLGVTKLYRVRRTIYLRGAVYDQDTSSRLSAFEPYAGAHIHCRLA